MTLARVLALTALSALVTVPAVANAQTGVKLAFIDSRVLVQRAPGTAAAEQALQKEGEALQARVKMWQDSLAAMVDAYRKTEATLTAAQKEAQQKRLDDKRLEYSRRADSLDNQMQQRQAELSQPIMTQIREVLDAIKTEEGYTFIFDVSQGGFIVAADKNLDITEKVLGRLRPVPLAAKVDTSKAGGAKAQPAGVRKPPTE